jgi:hypothetical protein
MQLAGFLFAIVLLTLSYLVATSSYDVPDSVSAIVTVSYKINSGTSARAVAFEKTLQDSPADFFQSAATEEGSAMVFSPTLPSPPVRHALRTHIVPPSPVSAVLTRCSLPPSLAAGAAQGDGAPSAAPCADTEAEGQGQGEGSQRHLGSHQLPRQRRCCEHAAAGDAEPAAVASREPRHGSEPAHGVPNSGDWPHSVRTT